jgi:hypothetical protein
VISQLDGHRKQARHLDRVSQLTVRVPAARMPTVLVPPAVPQTLEPLGRRQRRSAFVPTALPEALCPGYALQHGGPAHSGSVLNSERVYLAGGSQIGT